MAQKKTIHAVNCASTVQTSGPDMNKNLQIASNTSWALHWNSKMGTVVLFSCYPLRNFFAGVQRLADGMRPQVRYIVFVRVFRLDDFLSRLKVRDIFGVPQQISRWFEGEWKKHAFRPQVCTLSPELSAEHAREPTWEAWTWRAFVFPAQFLVLFVESLVEGSCHCLVVELFFCQGFSYCSTDRQIQSSGLVASFLCKWVH